MKYALSLLFFVLTVIFCGAQDNKSGIVEVRKFLSPSIQGNAGGEDPMRSVSIYLPPGYAASKERYPAIYFLHGVSTTDTEMFEWLGLKQLMDKAITTGRIRPMILVLPNSYNLYRGSFYTNSTLTGNWADFIGKDVVAYTDKNFRTIPNRSSRGICGHSMGGNGALKIGMLFADTFSSVYALSPAVLNWSDDFTTGNSAFKKVGKAKNAADILNSYDSSQVGFFAGVFSSLARAYSPDKNSLPVQAKFPVSYIGDSAVFNMEVIKQWEANFPVNMIEAYLPALKSLAAIKIDWGRNEDFPHIPTTAMQFSKKLETYKIKHFAEEYIGDHGNMLDGFEGRIYTELLPFFDTYLKFENDK